MKLSLLVQAVDDAFSLPGSYGTLAVARRAWAEYKAALAQQTPDDAPPWWEPGMRCCKWCGGYDNDHKTQNCEGEKTQQAQPEMPTPGVCNCTPRIAAEHASWCMALRIPGSAFRSSLHDDR